MQHAYPRPASLEAYERGGDTELRFFEAMQCPEWRRPFWMLEIRHATREQDKRGIDAIARLDQGEVEVQLKTSHAGRLQHREKYGWQQCVVVISPFMTPQQIRSVTTDILYIRRGLLFKIQRRERARR